MDFTKLTHSQALDQLRSAQDKVTLSFERKSADSPESVLYQDLTVSLARKAGRGLGLSLVGRRDGPGVFISALVPGGVAESTGQLLQGDQIIKVNDRDLSSSTQVIHTPCLVTVTRIYNRLLVAGRSSGSSQGGSW